MSYWGRNIAIETKLITETWLVKSMVVAQTGLPSKINFIETRK